MDLPSKQISNFSKPLSRNQKDNPSQLTSLKDSTGGTPQLLEPETLENSQFKTNDITVVDKQKIRQVLEKIREERAANLPKIMVTGAPEDHLSSQHQTKNDKRSNHAFKFFGNVFSYERSQLERVQNEFAKIMDSERKELFETVESIIGDTEDFLESKLTIRYQEKTLIDTNQAEQKQSGQPFLPKNYSEGCETSLRLSDIKNAVTTHDHGFESYDRQPSSHRKNETFQSQKNEQNLTEEEKTELKAAEFRLRQVNGKIWLLNAVLTIFGLLALLFGYNYFNNL